MKIEIKNKSEKESAAFTLTNQLAECIVTLLGLEFPFSGEGHFLVVSVVFSERREKRC